MLQFILLLLSFYNSWQVIRTWRSAREFGLSSALWVGWLLSASGAAAAALFMFIPGISPQWLFFRPPAVLQWFVPGIVIGREVRRKLEILGTSRTERIEEIASSTMWISVINLALSILIVVHAMMVAKSMEMPEVPR